MIKECQMMATTKNIILPKNDFQKIGRLTTLTVRYFQDRELSDQPAGMISTPC